MAADRSAVPKADELSLASVIERRHSHRAFLSEPVPHEVIQRMFALASRAPSWCNTQPWHAYVTEDGATERFRAALQDDVRAQNWPAPDIAMPSEYRGAHLERRRECGWQLYEAVGVTRGDREASARQSAQNFELFGAPHVAVITVDAALGSYGVLDVGVFVGHLLLVAESLGVAAIAQAAIATRAPVARRFFEIPDAEAVLLGVSFGWSDDEHPANSFRTHRVEVDSFVRWHG